MKANVPWDSKDSRTANSFSAQVYDAVMAVATAAQNWYKEDECYGKPDQCIFTRANMLARFEANFEVSGAIGNTVDCKDTDGRCFTFVEREGPPSYEIVNAVGDQWIDVGDYGDAKLTMRHKIAWPGGLVTVPNGLRPAGVAGYLPGGTGGKKTRMHV